MAESYQTVTLVLADGRRVKYTGKVQLDPLFQPRIVEVLVSRPMKLPEGMSWDVVEGEPVEQTEAGKS